MTITNIAVITPAGVTVVAAPYAPAGPILAGTSSTPNDIGIGGTYSWVMNELGLGFLLGTRVRASALDDLTQYIEGIVTAWDGTTVFVASDLTEGFGEHQPWNISTAGQPGKKGDKGDTGNVGPQGPPGGAPLDSPNFTGDPKAPNQTLGDNDTSIANTHYVHDMFALAQPLDADLTSLAAASAVGVMYYRSAADTWQPVTIGTNMTFAGGTLSATLTGTAPINNPVFTGDPQAPTPATADNDTSIATTAYVKANLALYALINSPAFTGAPTAPAPTVDSSNQLATAIWVTSKLSGFQSLDADLTSLANASASDAMYYRSAPGTWSPVSIGANIGFSGGVLSAAGGSGGGGIAEAPNDGKVYGRRSLDWAISVPEAPTDGFQYIRQSAAWINLAATLANKANVDSPTFTGNPAAPTPTAGDNDTSIATTAFVQTAIGGLAPLANPTFTGDPKAPTPATADNDTSIATTAFVKAQLYAPLASPAFTGSPTTPLPAVGDNTNLIASTAWVLANTLVTAARLQGSALSISAPMINGKIVETRTANAATFSLKTLAGTDPTAADPVLFSFNDGTGGYVVRTVTAAMSLTLSSGSLVGAANGIPFRLWIAAFDDSGTVRLAVIKAMTSTGYKALVENLPATTTAEGGAGAADNAGVFYTATAIGTARYFRVIAHADYDAGLVTAGAWAVAPTRIVLVGPGAKLPGDIIQSNSFEIHAVTTTTSATMVDSTLTVKITPTNACNPIVAAANLTCGQTVASLFSYFQIRRGGVAIGQPKVMFSNVAIGGNSISIMDFPSATAEQTYTLGYRTDAGGAASLSAGSAGSELSVTEVMA